MSSGVLILFSLAKSASAADLSPPGPYNNLGKITVDSVVSGVIEILLFFAFVTAMIFLLIGGIRWIMAGGDKAAAESAKGAITAAIIGLIIVLGTWAILIVVQTLFGIKIIGAAITFPDLLP